MIQRPIERVVEEFLVAAAPASVPAGLQTAILEGARRTPQRRPITVVRGRYVVPRRTLLAAAALAIAIAMLGILSLGSPTPSPTSTPGPSGPATSLPPSSPEITVRANGFRVPFTYTLPRYLFIRVTDLRFEAYLNDSHGVNVAMIDTPSTDSCGIPRAALRSDPAEFLADLEGIAGAALSDPVSVSVGGRSALQVDVEADGTCAFADVHMDGGRLNALSLHNPTRLIAFEAGGHRLAITLWAKDQPTFDAWLPVAQRFVDSISFNAPPDLPPTLPPSSPRLAGHTVLGEFGFVGFDYLAPEYLTASSDQQAFTLELDPNPSVPGAPPIGGHGITVAVVDTPYVHGDPERVRLRSDGAGFLEDLESLGRVALTEPIRATVHGRLALQVDVDLDRSGQASDLHLTNGLAGTSNTIAFQRPTRLIVLEDRAPGGSHLGGHHLLIVIWAMDDATFEAWLPTAEGIVESIRFNPL